LAAWTRIDADAISASPNRLGLLVKRPNRRCIFDAAAIFFCFVADAPGSREAASSREAGCQRSIFLARILEK
jgi:hypothetical protein